MFPGEISVKKHMFERSELCFLGNKPLETLNPKRLMSVLFFLLYIIFLNNILYIAYPMVEPLSGADAFRFMGGAVGQEYLRARPRR